MTIANITDYVIFGAHTDTKPLAGIAANTLFFEIDTGDIYKFTGGVWSLFSGSAKQETLTNKTLTLPTISSISNSGTVTVPTGNRTLVGRDTTDTLSNKTLTFPVISTISNGGVITLPTGTRTLVARDTADTLLSKTISVNSNTLTATSQTAGDILVNNGSQFIRLARGSTGQVLTATSSTVNWAGSSSGSAIPNEQFAFYIYRDTSNYKALNLDTGATDYTSTNLTDCKAVVTSVLTAAAGRPILFGKGQFTFLSQLDLSGISCNIVGQRSSNAFGGSGDTTQETVWKKNYTDTTNGFIKSYANVTYTKQEFRNLVIQGDDNGIGFDGYAYNERYNMFNDVAICHFDIGYKAKKVWQVNYWNLVVYYCKSYGILLDWDGSTGIEKCFCNYFFGGEVRFCPIDLYCRGIDDAAFYSTMLEGNSTTLNSINYTTTNCVKIDVGSLNIRFNDCSFETPTAGVDIITMAGHFLHVNACRFGGTYTGNQNIVRCLSGSKYVNITNNNIEPFTASSSAAIVLDSGCSNINIMNNGLTAYYTTGLTFSITDSSGNSGTNTIIGNIGPSATIPNVIGPSTTLKNNLTVNGQTQAVATAASGFESVFKASITGSTDGFTLDNGFSEAGVFSPIIRSTVTSTNTANYHNGLYFQGIISAANDTGTEPIVVFAGTRPALAAVTTRPMASFRNGNNDVFRFYPTYMDVMGNQIQNSIMGGVRWAITTKTGNYTATDTDVVILCDTTSSAITITLPAASGRAGKFYAIHRKAGTTNAITIDPNASETIDGATTITVPTTAGSSKWIFSDGTSWYSK